MSSNIFPLQLSYYKGMGGNWGALQIRLQEPHFYCPKCKKHKDYDSFFPPDKCPKCNHEGRFESREGCLFFEICSADGKNQYNWTNKVIMAFSTKEQAKMLRFAEGARAGTEVKLFHDPGAKSATQGQTGKTLVMFSKEGAAGGCMVTISQTDKDQETVTHKVPMDGDELKELAVCIRAAIPRCLNW